MNVLLHIDSKSVVDNLTNDCKDSVVGNEIFVGTLDLDREVKVCHNIGCNGGVDLILNGQCPAQVNLLL